MDFDLINKRKHPQYRFGRSKQIKVFDEERRKSIEMPSPFSYTIQNDLTKFTRYQCN